MLLKSIPLLLSFARGLRFKNLFFIILGLFILDFFIPDFIPFADEIVLGILTFILGKLKK